jgi:type VI secretion system secreted protein Hcp
MFDSFLKIASIPGESTDDKHKDWIEVLSYSWGVSQAGSRGPGGGTARVNHQDFNIVHALDKASPKLFLSCCNGEHLNEVTLALHRATGDRLKYMEYKMSDVIVTSVAPSGTSSGSEATPLEQVSFNYGKIELTYTFLDQKTSKDSTAGWDLTKNKGG